MHHLNEMHAMHASFLRNTTPTLTSLQFWVTLLGLRQTEQSDKASTVVSEGPGGRVCPSE